ncbi:hypothetical protein [Shewanella sp. YLB-07]|uniref:hypothetical protein n=1 Tax=Shewanella sp. YLB-07 TaxID=2601268 RepID=UPI00128CC0C4|nr:hypothetical protein [Shewanella sp. YLB-07]MPY24550.1 hypothetical protein [Shewanella sp. YLB-07]
MNPSRVAIAIATSALAVSLYAAWGGHKEQNTVTATHVAPQEEDMLLALEEKVRRLELQLGALTLSDNNSNNQSAASFKAAVLAVIAQKEQLEQDKYQSQDPLFAYRNKLSDDFYWRIKTDPEYALQFFEEAKQKVINDSLSAAERIAAYEQLEMTAFTVNSLDDTRYDYETVNAILTIANTESDSKIRLMALEKAANSSIVDSRLSERFFDMAQSEQNDYMRSIATSGLVSQYYQSQYQSEPSTQRIAQHIMTLYDQTNDPKIKRFIDSELGGEEALNQVRDQAENGVKIHQATQ